MTQPEPTPAVLPSSIPSILAQTATDTTGLDTFARYLWQAKQAVRQWLTCLSQGSPPLFIVCEHVEDLVVVYPDKVRFVQLKTHDRGSWSASQMCDEGLDSLIKSYGRTLESGLYELATFELWLEGPIANRRETVAFVKDPREATAKIKDKLLSLGAAAEWLEDFLSRLIVHANQPPQAHVDAIAIREISCIWPGLTKPELDRLYERLLQAATSAQSGAAQVAVTCACISEVLQRFQGSSDPLPYDESTLLPIQTQILSVDSLMTQTPPVLDEAAEQILRRISEGSEASMLELKMTYAGARPETIKETQFYRAQMETKRQLILASRANAEDDLERLAERVLSVANATARSVLMSTVVNPVVAVKPAEAIAMQLLSQPANLGNLDDEKLFLGDGLTVFGFLGHLSDLCRYAWRAA